MKIEPGCGTLRLLTLMLTIVFLSAGCGKNTKGETPNTGSDNPTTLASSPISGKELNKAKDQLEIDARLLEVCPNLPPPPRTAHSALDMSAVKKTETAMYYACAYRHNALVRFLSTKLGIVAGPEEQP